VRAFVFIFKNIYNNNTMLIGILEASAKWLLSLSVALLNAKVITVLTHTHIQRQYPVCEWSSGLASMFKQNVMDHFF
jgi:hypothetical protein